MATIHETQTVHVDIDRTHLGDDWRTTVAQILQELADRFAAGRVTAGEPIFFNGEPIGRVYGNRDGGAR